MGRHYSPYVDHDDCAKGVAYDELHLLDLGVKSPNYLSIYKNLE